MTAHRFVWSVIVFVVVCAFLLITYAWYLIGIRPSVSSASLVEVKKAAPAPVAPVPQIKVEKVLPNQTWISITAPEKTEEPQRLPKEGLTEKMAFGHLNYLEKRLLESDENRKACEEKLLDLQVEEKGGRTAQVERQIADFDRQMEDLLKQMEETRRGLQKLSDEKSSVSRPYFPQLAPVPQSTPAPSSEHRCPTQSEPQEKTTSSIYKEKSWIFVPENRVLDLEKNGIRINPPMKILGGSSYREKDGQLELLRPDKTIVRFGSGIGVICESPDDD